MSDVTWVLIASAVAWLGIGAYMIYMARVQKTLEQRLSIKESIDV